MNATQENQAFTLNLTEEERKQLLAWLEQRLRNKFVEERHTDASEYRQFVVRQEEILEGLIDKLRRQQRLTD